MPPKNTAVKEVTKKRKRPTYVALVTSAIRRIWGWSQLRRDALKSAGHCCEECGASAKSGAKLEVHHVVECNVATEAKRVCEKLFPPIDQLDVLCKSCHHERHRRDK